MKRKYIADTIALSDCGCQQCQGEAQGSSQGQPGEIPGQLAVLPVGKPVVCTINGKVVSFTIQPEDAQNMEKEAVSRDKEICLDWDHSTLNEEAAAQGNAPAAGWFKGVKYDPQAQQIVMPFKEISEKAQAQMKDGSYKYVSPVVLFDEKTGRPNAIHSVAMTNHPAIHGAPRILAASDLPYEMADRKFEDYATALREMRKAIDTSSEVMEGTLKALSDFAKGSDYEAKLTALTDELFIGALALADSDPAAKVAQVDKSRSGEDQLKFIAEKLKTLPETSPERKSIADEAQRLTTFKTQYPELWSVGITEAPNAEEANKRIAAIRSEGAKAPLGAAETAASAEQTSSPAGSGLAPQGAAQGGPAEDEAGVVDAIRAGNATQGLATADSGPGGGNIVDLLRGGKDNTGIPMSDIAPMLGIPPKDLTREKALEQILMMSDIRMASVDFLLSQKCKSFAEVAMKFNDALTTEKTKNVEMEKLMLNAKVDGRIAKALNDGQIMESEVQTYRELAVKDLALFDRIVGAKKPVFDRSISMGHANALPMNDGSHVGFSGSGTPIPGKNYTEEERDAWQKMGGDPDYIASVREKSRGQGKAD